jgi:hypothetical protein
MFLNLIVLTTVGFFMLHHLTEQAINTYYMIQTILGTSLSILIFNWSLRVFLIYRVELRDGTIVFHSPLYKREFKLNESFKAKVLTIHLSSIAIEKLYLSIDGKFYNFNLYFYDIDQNFMNLINDKKEN